MTLPACDLQTSLRVQDSLERGLSYFMAALARLKGVVDAAEHEREGRVLVYLLDEILQGTNSAERSIAVRAVARHLLDAGAIGAMTTHDLAVAGEEPLASVGAAAALHRDRRSRRHDAVRLHAATGARDFAQRAAADAADWNRPVNESALPEALPPRRRSWQTLGAALILVGLTVLHDLAAGAAALDARLRSPRRLLQHVAARLDRARPRQRAAPPCSTATSSTRNAATLTYSDAMHRRGPHRDAAVVAGLPPVLVHNLLLLGAIISVGDRRVRAGART